MAFDPKRLLVTLQTTGLQNRDSALYQLLKQIIDILASNINAIVAISNSSGGGSVINQILQNFNLGDNIGGDDNSLIIPGPQGIQGPQGIIGPILFLDDSHGEDIIIPASLDAIDGDRLKLNVQDNIVRLSTAVTSLGGMAFTPATGSGFSINLSATGDFAVNTNQLYVDTSTGFVGIGTSTPPNHFSIKSSQPFPVGFYDSSGNLQGEIVISSGTTTRQNGYNLPVVTGTGGNGDGWFQLRFNGAANKIFFGNTGAISLMQSFHPIYFMAGVASLSPSNTPDMVLNDGIVGIGTASFPGTGTIGIVFADGTALSSMASNTAGVYADSVGATVEKFAINEDNELTRITGLIARNSAQFDKTTSTVLATVTGLTRNVAAGITYAFEAILFIDANVTGGSKFAIAGSATATSIIYYIELLDDATNALTIVSRQTALGGSAGQAGTVNGRCIIRGTITVNAAGTLLVQFAQNVSNGTSSVLANSTFKITQVT